MHESFDVHSGKIFAHTANVPNDESRSRSTVAIYKVKRGGPSTEPCRTPHSKAELFEVQ